MILTFLCFIEREIVPYILCILFEFSRKGLSRRKGILELTLALISLAFLCLQGFFVYILPAFAGLSP